MCREIILIWFDGSSYHNTHTMFILIEALRARLPVQEYHLLRLCLFLEKTIIVIETPLTPYILQVFIVMTYWSKSIQNATYLIVK